MAGRNRSGIRYDSSMVQGDGTIFLVPRDSAAAHWYDCSMLQGDETIFLVPGRRFVGNGHRPVVRNQGFPLQDENVERRMMIAEQITSKVVRDDRVDDDGVCVVCLDNLVAENQKIARLDCGHCFHQRCITNWVFVKNNCPLCKTTVV